MFKCTLEQDELEEEYMGIYKHGQMIKDQIYGQISYNCCLSNAFKLKLGHNVKICVVQMMRATGKEIAEHVIRPTKVIRASRVMTRREQLLISVSNGSGLGLGPEPNRCNSFYHTQTRTVAIGPVLPPKTRHFNLTTLAPIKYLSSDCIVT